MSTVTRATRTPEVMPAPAATTAPKTTKAQELFNIALNEQTQRAGSVEGKNAIKAEIASLKSLRSKTIVIACISFFTSIGAIAACALSILGLIPLVTAPIVLPAALVFGGVAAASITSFALAVGQSKSLLKEIQVREQALKKPLQSFTVDHELTVMSAPSGGATIRATSPAAYESILRSTRGSGGAALPTTPGDDGAALPTPEGHE